MRLARLSRPEPSLSQDVERVAIAVHDLFGLRQLLSKGRIVGRQLVTAVWPFVQVQRFPVLRTKAIDDLLGQDDAERVAKFADFEFDYEAPPSLLLL